MDGSSHSVRCGRSFSITCGEWAPARPHEAGGGGGAGEESLGLPLPQLRLPILACFPTAPRPPPRIPGPTCRRMKATTSADSQ